MAGLIKPFVGRPSRLRSKRIIAGVIVLLQYDACGWNNHSEEEKQNDIVTDFNE